MFTMKEVWWALVSQFIICILKNVWNCILHGKKWESAVTENLVQNPGLLLAVLKTLMYFLVILLFA